MNWDDSNIQKIMDKAYKRWQLTHVSQETFWRSLSNKEMLVVFIGNMNQQVCNGGWSQWHYNGYSKCVKQLIPMLRAIGHYGKEAADLVYKAYPLCKKSETAENKIRNENYLEFVCKQIDAQLDPLDSAYYKIDDLVLTELEAAVNIPDELFEDWWYSNRLPLRRPIELVYVAGMPTERYLHDKEWCVGVL